MSTHACCGKKMLWKTMHLGFFTYTIEKDIFDKLMRLPNFDMIKSFGGKHDKFIDTKKDKHAKVKVKAKLSLYSILNIKARLIYIMPCVMLCMIYQH